MSKKGKLIEMKKAVQLKIVLKDIKPPIWRRFLVLNSITFKELHETIQRVMGWENYHLYEFEVDNYRIGEPNEDFDFNDGSKTIGSDKITLAEVLSGTIEKFSYLYDFGDYWDHEISVEKTLPLDEKTDYPVCIKGKMNCPPEDCGGVPGFYELVEIMADKNHSERRDMIEWLGAEFKPKEFDLDLINYSLRIPQEEDDDDTEDDDLWEESMFGDDEDYFDDEDEFFGVLPDVPVRVVNKSKHDLPCYETEGSAGMDIRASIEGKISLKPLERALVKTGLFIELPVGFEMQVRPRSGLALKHGITVLNSPGTIDADYRGEIGVLLVNLSSEIYTIEDGERIAQLIVAHHERVDWEEVDRLDGTERGEGGFGSTGLE